MTARTVSARVRPPAPARRRAPVKAATAQEMSAQQKEISVAEFFQKNRHLLGFDNPRKALLTTVKEAVDNSLDACEEAGILPEIEVKIEVAPGSDGKLPPSPAQADRFMVTVADNGPGIVKKNISKVFAKLLYGSKFHRLRMSRGQQGIGISAAGMYGQLTTGKPTKVISRIARESKAHCFEVSIDTKKNEPVEHETSQIDWGREHGTSVSIELTGKYQKGKASVDEYLQLTSIANPHAQLTYHAPDGTTAVYKRGVEELPVAPREIKPHPYGIELGMLLKMMQDTKSHWLSGFLSTEFVRVSSRTAEDICKKAGLNPRIRPRDVVGKHAEALYRAFQETKIMAPPTDCLSPIGEQAVLAGLVKTIKADFYAAATRPPKVYRGNPFMIECGLAFGKGDGALDKPPEEAGQETEDETNAEGLAEGEGEDHDTELATVIRFANRVPLLYQQSACATYKSVLKTAWRGYGLSQSRGAPPQGPLVIFIHMASVWVPFTSEAKEAIAEYDEIVGEVKRALQECGRKLGIWIRKRRHARSEYDRRTAFQRYIEEVATACKSIKGGKLDAERLKKQLSKIAEDVTGGMETDRLLNKQKEPEDDMANTVVLTEAGLTGTLPELAKAAAAVGPASPPAETAELIEGAFEKKAPAKKEKKGGPAKRSRVDDIPVFSHGKQIAGSKKVKQPTLFDTGKPKKTADKAKKKK